MAKAAQREAIVSEDFVNPGDPKVGLGSTNMVQPHNIPSLEGTDDNDDDNEDSASTTRVLPININLLKEFMQKRIQKGIEKAASTGSNRKTTQPV
jgi:hypothetical protein